MIAGGGIAMVPNLTFGITNSIPGKKLNIALIGVGLRGTNHLNNLLKRSDVNVFAICDLDANRINIALDLIAKAGKKKLN